MRVPATMGLRAAVSSVALGAALSASSGSTGPPSLNVSVGAFVQGLSPVAPNFVGFSLEIYSVEALIGRAGGPPQQSYAQLLRNLHALSGGAHAGPVIRVGGDSAEQTCFVDSEHPPAPGCTRNLTLADLGAYRRFAEIAPNISYVIDTNLQQGSPAVGARHIAALGQAGLWPHVSAVEIGNECDHWPAAQQLSFAAYESRFGAFAAAYAAAGMPARMLQGATFCCLNPLFLAGLRPYSRRFSDVLKTISYHRYPTSHCAHPNLTASAILSRDASAGQAVIMKAIAEEVAPIPLWGGEVNSASCGGAPNASDTFAATLWVLDFLSELSKASVAGVNFHGGPQDVYSPAKYANGRLSWVSPLYVGLLAWSELVANSSRWLEATVEKSAVLPNSFAHATLQPDGSGQCKVLRVVVVAKDEGGSGSPLAVRVDLRGVPALRMEPEAQLLRLTGSLASTTGVDWAGHSWDDSKDGLPSGARKAEVVRAEPGSEVFAFEVPQLSAAMLVVRDCSSHP